MYRVTIYNGDAATIIHEPTVRPEDPHLYAGTLVQGSSGEIDSLTMELLPNNPGYDLLSSRTTLVQVLDTTTDEAIFTGRALTITPQMEDSGLIYKTVVCEDRLGYLCDSIQPYTPEATYTLEDFFSLLLANHNAQVEDYKKIYPGTISVTTGSGNVTKGLNYETTWECIKSKLLDSVGGEIQLYVGTDGLLYLDYVPELGSIGTATIALGKNMQSISREIDPTSVITRLIPLGAKNEVTEDDPDADTEERLTIASVNDGVIYLDDEEAQAVYGIVEGVVEWEDVTEPANLLAKAKAWLEAQTVTDQITLTAVDLYLAGLESSAIERYNYYLVSNELIGLNTYYRVAKVTRNICNPTEITYEMGSQSKSLASVLTDASSKASSAVNDATAAVNSQLSKTVTALIVSNAYIQSLATKVADIDSAYIDTASIKTLLADYASIDLANVSVESVGKLFADVGLLTSMTVEDGYVTGTLNGVTINADLITAGTLSVDRLLLTGEDGVIYAINATSSGLTETELEAEEYQKYLNGTCIVANSITATQIAAGTITANEIDVNNLFAQDITATGTITGVTIKGATGDFSGSINTKAGTIGGWAIGETMLSTSVTIDESTYKYYLQGADFDTTYSAFGIQCTDSDGNVTYPFRVGYNGAIDGRQLLASYRIAAGSSSSMMDGTPGVVLTADGEIALKSDGSSTISFYPSGSTSSPATIKASSSGFTINSAVTVSGNGAFSGSLSTYGYTVPRMLHGYVSVTVSASTSTTFSVTFSSAFSGTPDVVLTPRHSSTVTNLACKIMTVSTTGFTGYIYSSGSGTHAIHWIAMYG
ncbi:MAG: phage tail protein [Clostridiales bacterium]|nr:phage tail protein [Clostridiales bacterium]